MEFTDTKTKKNPFASLVRELPGHGKYYSLKELNDNRLEKLPYSIRILLEAALRCCDEFEVHQKDVETILNWEKTSKVGVEIPFKPSRVLLQDFTGVPCGVDLAALRDATCKLGGNPEIINPLVPVDLVIDHSVQVKDSRNKEALEKNQDFEFEQNQERFAFLKWGASAFSNMLIVPPGSGICHQFNLEYLARVVFSKDGYLFPDSVVGTDSHTTMVDGLGVAGWGVGGIEAEAVMLGQPISMTLPEVIGFELVGELPSNSTATDLVLSITKMLREHGVVGKFVEFFGTGCQFLSLADRATISNMSPEYGATMGFFPVDHQTMAYLEQSGRPKEVLDRVEMYLKAQGLFRLYNEDDKKIQYSGNTLCFDLSTLVPCAAGPKRPHDRILIKDMQKDFISCLTAKIGFKGYGLTAQKAALRGSLTYKGTNYSFGHGSIAIAAITSCTNTSNPSVMLGAGLLAKAAVEAGLSVRPYIKTSLSPGSEVVLKYLKYSGLLTYLERLGFFVTGFGCQTCIGNSGELDSELTSIITSEDYVAAAVLSGNRNFEGRVHPLTRANYLMSPMLVVAYALASTVNIDFETTPLGEGTNGKQVFLRDIWPSREEIKSTEQKSILPAMFQEVYNNIQSKGSKQWRELKVSHSTLYNWNEKSTYIHNPPFFQDMKKLPQPAQNISKAYCLLYLGDSITTDHISPAGNIAKKSPAAQYLMERNVDIADFNSYGSRRGNDEIMTRGTFANIRIINKLVSNPGPTTIYFPTHQEMSIFDAAQEYGKHGESLIIIAGKEYGCGSSRDWAAKGPHLLGVKAVIAESFERIHRSNLVGMGILPLQFIKEENAELLNIKGDEKFSIALNGILKKPRQLLEVIIHNDNKENRTFQVQARIDTEVELEYFNHGGILHYVLRKLLQ